MKLPFEKYHGTGNDFILIDSRTQPVLLDEATIALLCNRHLGIGADGLMLLSTYEGFDFGMTYFNSDGRESTMCGNGGRCIAAFASSLTGSNHFRFMAADGIHEASIVAYEHPIYRVRLTMSDVVEGIVHPDGIFLDTGSPHFVSFVEDIDMIDVASEGRRLRYDKRFAPGGTNVDFVQMLPQSIRVRTFERGVEGETLSCGTGVTAAAIAVAMAGHQRQSVTRIGTPGGKLMVSFDPAEDHFSHIVLEGPAQFVFAGIVEI